MAIDPSSTATEGVDFTPFPESITIPAGEMTDTIYYSAFNDGIEEGTESIIIAFSHLVLVETNLWQFMTQFGYTMQNL